MALDADRGFRRSLGTGKSLLFVSAMKSVSSRIAIYVGLPAVLLLIGLVTFLPVIPRSWRGVCALVFVGIPAMLAIEQLGTTALSPKFITGWPRSLRILYAVGVMSLLIIVFVQVVGFVSDLIAL